MKPPAVTPIVTSAPVVRVASRLPRDATRHGAPAFHAALGRAAIGSLYDELALEPKPGLVSFVDAGSHADMDAGTFLRSLFALRHFFAHAASLGADGARFEALQAAGIDAESRMLYATGGVNTHRGAIFTIGLLCAAAGAARSAGAPCTADAIRAALLGAWGAALRRRTRGAARGGTHGTHGPGRHGLRTAGDEAALGLPTLFERVVPALKAARALGLDDRRARLHALLAAMAALDDTNLVHRGGLRALRDVQAVAREFVADGGGALPDAIERARAMHVVFVARRLSPGGAADLLAAACWIERVERFSIGSPRA